MPSPRHAWVRDHDPLMPWATSSCRRCGGWRGPAATADGRVVYRYADWWRREHERLPACLPATSVWSDDGTADAP